MESGSGRIHCREITTSTDARILNHAGQQRSQSPMKCNALIEPASIRDADFPAFDRNRPASYTSRKGDSKICDS